jgi:hypothetical protein
MSTILKCISSVQEDDITMHTECCWIMGEGGKV